MDFHLTPQEEAFRDEVGAWLKPNLPEGWPGQMNSILEPI